VILGVGGSASTDGGAGMLQALGVRMLDSHGAEIGPGGAALRDLRVINLDGLDPRLRDVQLVLASDVDNPLLGRDGAAGVFGPQKGASRSDIAVLEAGLSRLAAVVGGLIGHDRSTSPGAGAAGGLGFSAIALLGARPQPGGELMLDLVDFHHQVLEADLVITGEGSLDAQSLHGKVPARVAAAAAIAGVPVVAVAGQVLLDREQLSRLGFARSYALVDREPDISRSMAGAAGLLESVGRELAASIDLIATAYNDSTDRTAERIGNQ
jgi:glycerate kinase